MTIDITTLNLRFYPDPILKAKCHDIDPCNPDLPAVLDKMVALMFAHNGLGLAAPQVGLDWNVFVVNLGQQEPRALINPRIESFGENKIKSEEGCLSIPGIVAKLEERYETITISACMPKSTDRITVNLYGQEAIVFQHEYDHLQGITFFDRMKQVQKMMSKKKYLKNKEKGEKLQQEFMRLKIKRDQLQKIIQSVEEAKNGKIDQSPTDVCNGGSERDHGCTTGASEGTVETAAT